MFEKMIIDKRFLPAALLLVLTWSACKRIEKDTPPAVQQAIARVQQRHCPDRRLCVFDISVQVRGANLKLVGEVSEVRAEREVLQAVKAVVSNFKVEAEIRLLPDPALGERRFGLVRVSVANLRAKPGHAAELVHQQLLGSVMRLLKQEGHWYYAQAEDGYLAWVPAGSIQIVDSAGVAAWRAAELVACKVKDGVLRIQPKDDAAPVSAIVLGGTARKLAEAADANPSAKKKWLELELPDGRRGFIERDQVTSMAEVFPAAPQAPQKVMVQAQRLLGVPYLWGGASSDGFDCSGFTQTVFRLNGVALLRDASQQARQGESLDPGEEFANLLPGDLLFFGAAPGKITHVALSLGGARFIHASDFVQINSLNPDDADYAELRRETFQFARRFWTQVPNNGTH